MHHKQLLSGSFRSGARRSPCLQTPLCPPRLRGPGCPGLQPRSTPIRGNPNTCAAARRAGRGGVRGVRPPGLPPPRRLRPAPPAHRQQRVERKGARVLVRSRKSNGEAEGGPTSLGRRPLGPRKENAGTGPDHATPLLYPRGSPHPRPVLRGRDPGSGRPQLGARSPGRAESRGSGEGSGRCGPGGPADETCVGAIGREGVVTGQGGEAALGHPRPALSQELRARGPKTGRRIKSPHCSP